MRKVIKALRLFVIRCTIHFKEVEYFHPEGGNMPNGICYQRGYFWHQCEENLSKFQMHDNNGVALKISCLKGCIVLFPSKTEITFTNNKYYHGNFFYGEYIGIGKDKYEAESICVYIDDKNIVQSLIFAYQVARENNIRHFLVKDLEENKIYRTTL